MADRVNDEEHLHRRVQNLPNQYFSIVDGAVRFSSTVFNDRSHKISVDRAVLRDSPEQTKIHPTDGVVTLMALEVRRTSPIKTAGTSAEDPPLYNVDVIPRPIPAGNAKGLPENLAHAQIESDPEFKLDKRFKKLKEALARVLNESQRGWTIAPS